LNKLYGDHVHDVADKCHEFQFSNSVDLHINKTKMIALIKSLLGLGEKVNIKELIANGAQWNGQAHVKVQWIPTSA